MRLKRTATALAAASLLAVAACGGGGGSEDSSDRQTLGEGGNAGSGQDAEAEAPAADVEGATAGGTITVNANVAPETLDPTRAYYTDSTAIMSGLVTRSLTQYKYDAETKEMVLVPDMATDLGQASDDNKTWTFTLREGLKYEDGTDVKAEDVAYAIKRSFAVEELPDGPTYNQTFFLDGDTYKGPFQDGDDYAGVETSGNDITIKMARPFGDMAYYASFPSFTAIPQAKDTNPDAYGNKPLATGPYKFESYQKGQSLTLVKNDQWDPATDTTRHQYADEYQFNFSQDQTKIDNVVLDDQGVGQTTINYTPIAPSVYDRAQESGRLAIGTQPCTFMWYIDNTKITDDKVRQALAWAYPYRAAWRAGGYIEGVTRAPSTSILPPGTAGRETFEAIEGQDGQTTDPAKAKALLKEAGAEGFEIKWPYQTDLPESVKAKDVQAQALTAAGFKATPVAATSDTIRALQSDASADLNIRSQGWCSDWPSGGSWFPAILDGGLVGQEGMPNKAQFKQADADEQQDKILDTLAGTEANDAWGSFDKFISQKYHPVVTIGYGGVALVHGSKIGGVGIDNVRGEPTYSDLYVKK
ncbi:MAG: ABC transporter substrate-binding protein [Nocardioidaceae bacterium]|nr:ABC transporter substrate-binding protein [Nocardioidaceae bacterium]